ncbi:MAG: SocA family protein [Tannerella sp.]|jgi:uncharacterized phage-associated protein|nr:SocA family protein [Tannerella sp.]
MKTKDEIDKIRAVVLYILAQFPNGIDLIKLFKIMYFAQKAHLVKYGRGIMGDSFYALKHGPVPSFTYKSIQVNQGKIKATADLDEIAAVISLRDNKMYAKIDVDKEELSVSDVKCIDNAIAEYKNVDSYALSDLSHDEAWKEAYMRSQDDPEKNKMTLIDIANAGNASTHIIDKIRESEQIRMAFS